MGLINYLKDTRSEMNHVSWPTKNQTVNFTIIVLVVSIFVGILLGAFDLIFQTGLKTFILH